MANLSTTRCWVVSIYIPTNDIWCPTTAAPLDGSVNSSNVAKGGFSVRAAINGTGGVYIEKRIKFGAPDLPQHSDSRSGSGCEMRLKFFLFT